MHVHGYDVRRYSQESAASLRSLMECRVQVAFTLLLDV
jgi:hypothetical protein